MLPATACGIFKLRDRGVNGPNWELQPRGTVITNELINFFFFPLLYGTDHYVRQDGGSVSEGEKEKKSSKV